MWGVGAQPPMKIMLLLAQYWPWQNTWLHPLVVASVACGLWSVVCGLWLVVCRQWSVVCGVVLGGVR